MLERLAPSRGGVEICQALSKRWVDRINDKGATIPHFGGVKNGWFHVVQHAIEVPGKTCDTVELAYLLNERFELGSADDAGRLASVLAVMHPAGAMAAASATLRKNLDWRPPDRFPFDASVRLEGAPVGLKHIGAITFERFPACRNTLGQDADSSMRIFMTLDDLNQKPEQLKKLMRGTASCRISTDDGWNEPKTTISNREIQLTPGGLTLLLQSDPLFLHETLKGAMQFSEHVTGALQRHEERQERQKRLKDPKYFEGYAGGADW